MPHSKLIKNLFIIGFPLLAILCILWAVVIKLPLPCVLYVTTGLYCPTCGATRAVIALLGGDLARAVRCNLPVTLLFFPAAAAAVWVYLSVLLNRPIRLGKPALYTAIAILSIFIVFGIIRNIPLEPFNQLIP